MEFRILGPLEARDGERVLELGGVKRRGLLALLLLDANRVVSVERLVDGLWGDAPPASAQASLQNHLGRLRRELGDRLVTRPPGYLLRVGDGELDLHRFQSLAVDGRWAEALALWRGPPLADLAGEPVGRAAAHLDELRLAALEERIDAELALGRHTAVVPELEELVAAEPYRERPRRQLILALYRSGRQADALDAYTEARRAFVDGLGTEPGRELQELQRAVLNRDPALDAPAVVEAPQRVVRTRVEGRKTVIVLAADVRRDDLPDDPEARQAELRERSGAAARVLEEHGATVQGVASGRLLGVFGVPAARDDDALQAARAAVALEAARVGLATGEVVTGDSLVSGAPVDEATMLRERAAVGEALASARAWRLLRHAATGSPRDGSWAIDAVAPDAVPLPRRFETLLVGRERQLEQIVEPFERAMSESRPHLVTVYGAPGIGKTRLAIECRELLAPSATVAFGRCRADEQDSPYAPLAETLASLGHGNVDDWLLGSPEETAWAARRLLAELAGERPLLLVFDDIHWAGPSFLELVESLVELARAPVLVLCLARPDLLDVRPHWGGGRLSASSVLLDALDETESDALLDLLAPGGDVERKRILAVAEGNPLFIEQLLAAAHDGDTDAIPDSIQTLIAARLDRLDDRDRTVAQAASVCGTSFTTGDVAALAGGDPSTSLLALMRRELVRPGDADEDWSFRHALIRDVAYGSLTKRARADLHERLAERAGTDLAAGHHLEEAVHARREVGERGADLEGLAERAVDRLGRAALAAYQQHQLAATASLLTRVNDLMPQESPGRLELAPKLASALVSVGDVNAARNLLAEASAIAAKLGDARLTAALAIGTDLALLWTEAATPPDRILADLAAAVPVLQEAGDYEHLAMAEVLRFEASDRTGVLVDPEWLRLALDYARRANAPHLENIALSWICIGLHRGQTPVEEGIARATEIRDGSTSTFVRTSAVGALGLLHAMRGEFTEARAHVAEVARTLDELGFTQASAAHSIAVAEVEMLAGDDAAAERILRDGFAATTALGHEHSAKNVAWRLALVLARQGRGDEAEPFVRLAREPEHQGYWVDVWWRVVLARIEPGRAHELVAQSRERMALVPESGMHADALLESADALRAARLDEAAATLTAEAAGIAGRLGYIVAQRRAVDTRPVRR